METSDFRDFNQLHNNAESPLQSKKKTGSGQNFLVSKVVHMKFLADSSRILYFKTSFDQSEFEKVNFNEVATSKRKRRHENQSQLLMPGTTRFLEAHHINKILRSSKDTEVDPQKVSRLFQ
nr:unnamed protein product [Callosobruchus chinensis]